MTICAREAKYYREHSILQSKRLREEFPEWEIANHYQSCGATEGRLRRHHDKSIQMTLCQTLRLRKLRSGSSSRSTSSRRSKRPIRRRRGPRRRRRRRPRRWRNHHQEHRLDLRNHYQEHRLDLASSLNHVTRFLLLDMNRLLVSVSGKGSLTPPTTPPFRQEVCKKRS